MVQRLPGKQLQLQLIVPAPSPASVLHSQLQHAAPQPCSILSGSMTDARASQPPGRKAAGTLPFRFAFDGGPPVLWRAEERMVLIVERPQESTQLHAPASVGAITNTLRDLVHGVLVAGWSDVGLHKPPSANPRTVFAWSLSGIEGQTKRPEDALGGHRAWVVSTRAPTTFRRHAPGSASGFAARAGTWGNPQRNVTPDVQGGGHENPRGPVGQPPSERVGRHRAAAARA